MRDTFKHNDSVSVVTLGPSVVSLQSDHPLILWLCFSPRAPRSDLCPNFSGVGGPRGPRYIFLSTATTLVPPSALFPVSQPYTPSSTTAQPPCRHAGTASTPLPPTTFLLWRAVFVQCECVCNRHPSNFRAQTSAVKHALPDVSV